MSTEITNLLRPFMSQGKPVHYIWPRKDVYFYSKCETCFSQMDGIWHPLHVDHLLSLAPSTHPCVDAISLPVVTYIF